MSIEALSPRLRWLVWFNSRSLRMASAAFAELEDAQTYAAALRRQRDRRPLGVVYGVAICDLDADPGLMRGFTATLRWGAAWPRDQVPS